LEWKNGAGGIATIMNAQQIERVQQIHIIAT